MSISDDLFQEVRDDVKALTTAFADFKGRVVMKEELELWQEAQRTTRRWAIGTVVAMLGIAVAAVGIILSL